MWKAYFGIDILVQRQVVNLVLEHLPVFAFPHSKLDALILLEESTKELLPVNLRLLGKEVIKFVFQIVLSEFRHR
ncbi:MAG: hypothetical protein SPD44_09325 [Prevotella sp.]|nr:hypothetical protein [Prevotella sp.]